MLEIKKISKIYKTEGFVQKALDKVSVNFRKCEFASILGPSGSGKTTFLNIIGGLDKYDSGNLIINEISTKNFSNRNWDSYRNHRVGFVFQSYNLIMHQSVLKNVELALTLSGCSKEERRKRALKALDDVGLKMHVNKKPNQLSGGQMQRVAIARAIVNDPEIILADEPTGALDSDTSVQIMKLLKEISKDKLVIMVTHNPDLAKKYSSRIINLKDGKIVSDSNPYNGKINTNQNEKKLSEKTKKTKMSFLTALSLSFNNLMTKKRRTILVSVAGSIGIIGIALILAVSTGFKKYVDSIGEDTLKSYPLTIMQESSDIAGTLLSIKNNRGKKTKSNKIKEQQYITSMLSNVSKNDLKSFKKHIEKNYSKIKNDVSNISYSYSVDPNIYTIDKSNKLAKINPSNLFTSMMGKDSLISSYSSMTSIYSQMVDDISDIKDDYDLLAGVWPKKYNEMIIVLSEKNSISDLLIYSLGLRDTEELTHMVTSIMNGESINLKNKPITLTYDDLLKVDLRLIMPSDKYKYNAKYDVYEDMSEDESYMKTLYDKALKLKIVGVISPKDGITTSSLNPGVSYTSKLVKYIIDYSKKTDIVKRQIKSSQVDIFSGKRFDSNKNNFNFEFSDLVKVDNQKLQSAFNINIDKKDMEQKTKSYMNEISESITTDITPAKDIFANNLKTLSEGIFQNVNNFKLNDIDSIVSNYINTYEPSNLLSQMESNYVVPKDTYKTVYTGLLKSLLQTYVISYNSYMKMLDENYIIDEDNPEAEVIIELKDKVLSSYIESMLVQTTINNMAKDMTEAKVKKDVLLKVGDLTSNITNSFAKSFNVDEEKIKSAFSLNFTENELARVVSAMMNPNKTTQKSNLISLGYQNIDEPTYISFYFSSFDGKEHFLSFIKKYNKKAKKSKRINYSDITGILMSSVRTIVNAVSYVLIAFVSISLVVSSIMIGVITYISVYERTKEIGILRAIGASKGNISSIFNAETFIVGLLSGLFGISVSYILIPIINKILHHYIGSVPLRASLPIKNSLLLIGLSIILTLIGGLIPAKSASKKDPVEALRSE